MYSIVLDNELSNNKIIQQAFQQVFFKKLVAEGYYNMNKMLGNPKIRKDEIALQLDKIKSPLTKLYKDNCKYPDSIDELKKNLLPILDKNDKNQLSDYSLFSIVYYIGRFMNKPDKQKKMPGKKVENFEKHIKDNNIKSSISKMDLKIFKGIIYDFNTVKLYLIESISEYVALLDKTKTSDKKMFFRGHSDISYKLLPSIKSV